MLCIFLPCLSAIAALAFSFDGYVRAKWGAWGEGALFDAWPLAVTQALGLTGLAFLPLLLLPEQDAGDYNTKIEKRRYAKLTPGRSLFAPLVAIVTFATLPEVPRIDREPPIRPSLHLSIQPYPPHLCICRSSGATPSSLTATCTSTAGWTSPTLTSWARRAARSTAPPNPNPNPNPNLSPKPLTLSLTLTPRQVDGAASLSSYVDSPFYAVLLVRVRA